MAINCTIKYMTENYSSLAKDVEKDFQRWFGDPVDPEPDDISFLPEAEYSNHRIGIRRVDTLQKLLEAFKFGFIGAVFLGTIAGLIIEFLSYWELYNKYWPDPIEFISWVGVIGFFIGMSIGLSSKLHT